MKKAFTQRGPDDDTNYVTGDRYTKSRLFVLQKQHHGMEIFHKIFKNANTNQESDVQLLVEVQ